MTDNIFATHIFRVLLLCAVLYVPYYFWSVEHDLNRPIEYMIVKKDPLNELVMLLDARVNNVRKAAGNGSKTNTAALVNADFAQKSASEPYCDIQGYRGRQYDAIRVDRADAASGFNFDQGITVGHWPEFYPMHLSYVEQGSSDQLCTVESAMVVASISDLGQVDYDSVVQVPAPSQANIRKSCAPAAKGHVYIIHCQTGIDNLWVKMKINDILKGRWIVFQWNKLKPPDR